MLKIKPFILCCLIISAVGALAAFSATYEIKAIGIKFADLTFECSAENHYTQVVASAKMRKVLNYEVDNAYRSEFDSLFLPYKYTRTIHQDKIDDEIEVLYDRKSLSAAASHTGPKGNYNYDITSETRDLFTTLSYLLNGNAESGNYTVDGNGCLWSVDIVKDGRSKIKTCLGEYSCTAYVIKMAPLFKGEMPYNDAVTHSLLSNSSKMTMWVSKDGIPMKATFKKGIFSSVCEIVSIDSP